MFSRFQNTLNISLLVAIMIDVDATKAGLV